jgi:hypothetical protein
MGIVPTGMPRFGGVGGMLGGMVLGNLAERATGDTSGLAYFAGSSATSALGGLPAAFGAPTLGGAGGALAASPAGVGLAAGASAYGGWQVGKGIYRAFNRKTFDDLSEGTSESTKKTFGFVEKSLNQGVSTKKIKEVLDGQIRSTQGIVQGGFRSFISHSGKENDEIKKSIEAMQALRDSIDQMKAQKDQEKSQKEYQEKLLAALQNMGNNDVSGGGNTSISVEISLKDVDKLPNIFNDKVIKPIEQQLKGLQNRTYNIEQSVGINPQPAGL